MSSKARSNACGTTGAGRVRNRPVKRVRVFAHFFVGVVAHGDDHVPGREDIGDIGRARGVER